MTDKTTLINDTKTPSLLANKIHPMIKRALQIFNTFEPTTSADWTPSAPSTLTTALDQLAAKEKVATGSLTAAQVIAALTPHTLIAAPAAGTVNIVKSIELFVDYAAAFTAGADFTIEYATTGTVIATFDAAALTVTADAKYYALPAIYATSGGTGATFVASADAAKAIVFHVPGATAFADGTGTVLKYRIKYETVTLIT
jgi:hypothetical protein